MRRWEWTGSCRFITFSCHRRLQLLGNPAIRDFFVDALASARLQHGFALYAWVVMPEHVHLLIRPGDGMSLAPVLRSLKTSVAKGVIGRWRELQAPVLTELTTARGTVRYWQKGGGFDRNVRSTEAFCRSVRYIHRNPVKRGLVAEPSG
ncbi:MAG: transposase [Phycisphaerales bacterium]